MQRILDRALAKSRDERYPDCRALQVDLERFILQTGEPVSQYQLTQLVQRVVPPTPAVPAPVPSVPPAPPIGVPPQSATVEEDVSLSTSLLATPPPQPSIIELVPRVRPPPSHQPPPPPVPTQTMPLPTPADARGPAEPVPMLPPAPPLAQQQAVVYAGNDAPPPQPRPSTPPRTVPDVGSISLRDEQSAERPLPPPPARTGNAVKLVAVFLAVIVGSVGTWLVLKPPAAELLAVAPVPKPEPVPRPTEPVVAKPPEPEPVAAKPTEPEPVAAKPTEPEPLVVKPTIDPPGAKTGPAGKAPNGKTPRAVKPPKESGGKPVQLVTGTVEFRVRPFGAVWVDGKFLGETPFSPAALSVGSHQVRVVNRDLGKEVSKTLDVREGSNVFRHSFDE
jgi:serine/threonine-protein kinase